MRCGIDLHNEVIGSGASQLDVCSYVIIRLYKVCGHLNARLVNKMSTETHFVNQACSQVATESKCVFILKFCDFSTKLKV